MESMIGQINENFSRIYHEKQIKLKDNDSKKKRYTSNHSTCTLIISIKYMPEMFAYKY